MMMRRSRVGAGGARLWTNTKTFLSRFSCFCLCVSGTKGVVVAQRRRRRVCVCVRKEEGKKAISLED